VPALAAPDTQHAIPAEANEALRNARLTLDQVKGSNLDSYWKADAMALSMRTEARTGNAEAVGAMMRDAVLMIQTPSTAPVPAAFSAGPLYAILAQGMDDVRNAADTRGLVNLSSQELVKIPDPAVLANVYPYLAQIAFDLGDADGAKAMVAIANQSVAKVKTGREKTSALALIAMTNAKLGDAAGTAAAIQAARAELPGISDPADRAIAEANIGRAEAANHNGPAARTLARAAASDYDAGTTNPQRSMLQAVKTLGLISMAQAESGDKSAARTTIKALRHTVETLTNPFEQLVGWLTLTDTIVQVEQR
jgi:hypothetical protein